MPTLVLDGPEKAGKTTLASAISKAWYKRLGPGSETRIRRWGPVVSDLEYLPALQSDAHSRDDQLIVWDRSWASEHIYSLLLQRDPVAHPLGGDPWLGEWLYGRAVQTMGLRVMVQCDPVHRIRDRDETDLDVDPYLEGMAFDLYGQEYGWHQATLCRDPEVDRMEAEAIVDKVLLAFHGIPAMPPTVAGPLGASVIVIGERRNEDSGDRGAWLPLTTRLTTQAARSLKAEAFECLWANAYDCPTQLVRRATHLVALGERAYSWAKFNVGHPNITELPHPAWLYRYGAAAEKITAAEQQFRAVLRRSKEQ